MQCLPAILLMLLSTSNGEGQNDFGAGKAKKIQIVYIKVPLSKVLQQSGQQLGNFDGMKVNQIILINNVYAKKDKIKAENHQMEFLVKGTIMVVEGRTEEI